MIELTDGQKIQINLMMVAILDSPNETDTEAGLYNVWDYLEAEGFPTHQVCQYIEDNGEFLTNRAMLAKMVDL